MFNKEIFKYELGAEVSSGDPDKRVLGKITGRGQRLGGENFYLVEITRLGNFLRTDTVDESKIVTS